MLPNCCVNVIVRQVFGRIKTHNRSVPTLFVLGETSSVVFAAGGDLHFLHHRDQDESIAPVSGR